MIKYTRLFITFLLAVIVLQAKSQSTATTSSPYSRYGIGDVSDQLLPQNIAMGGIAVATNTIGGYNTINQINPASYGKIIFTTIDVGLYTNISTFSQTGLPNEVTSNTRLSHISFAIPVTKHSALSFGLLPYSEMGYSYKQTSKTSAPVSPADTNVMNYIYSGDGGLSKVYLGYGFGIGKHLLLGANASYIFGDLKQLQSTEIPALYGTTDSRVEQDNHIKGANYDFGAQYTIDFSDTKHMVLGYSASVNSQLNVNNTYIVSQYTYDSEGNQNNAADSVRNSSTNGKLQLPWINRFGVSFQSDNKFLVGADYTMGKWSDLSIEGVNQGLQDSKMLNVGGQITPNANALSNFFALIDYRLGFIYEQTYLNVNSVNIKRYAATFGFGIPLPHDRASTAFYKINFSAEIGQRGALTQQLVKENYVNFHLGFTLNDKWFQRYKFE
jgi:hypothetical protein